MYREALAACRSFSSFRVRSLIFSALLLFFPPSRLSSFSLAASRARFPSFLFLSSFFFFLRSALFSWLEPAMRPRTSARVTNANTNGRTDGHARMHTGKPKRSAREWTRELSDPTRSRDLLMQRAACPFHPNFCHFLSRFCIRGLLFFIDL